MTLQKLTFIDKAEAAWSGAPDWVREIALLADAGGLAEAERRIGYSRPVLSAVLSKRYPGDLAKVEDKVRGALMGKTVSCPALGTINRNQCLEWQDAPFAPTDSARARVYRACRNGCPNSRIGRPKGGHHESAD